MPDKSKIIARRFNAHRNRQGYGIEIKIPNEAEVEAGDEFECRLRTLKGVKQIIYTEVIKPNGDNNGEEEI